MRQHNCPGLKSGCIKRKKIRSILSGIRHFANDYDSLFYGGNTNEKKQMVHTVCKRMEAIKLRSRVYEIDPHAFTIITTSSDIIGRGFRSV